MQVGQRLLLAVAPAVVGALAVAGLAYWGQYARQAPGAIVAVAGAAAVLSLLLAWRNTRYVARRIEAIAARGAGPRVLARQDELDAIERDVGMLSEEVAVARREAESRAAAAEARHRELARFLAESAESMAARLGEARLPLHILLENHFGELNENQEEMLGAASQGAAAALELAERLRTVGRIDAGELVPRQDAVPIADVVESLRPMLEAAAESRGVQVLIALEPLLPAVSGDRTMLQEALALLARDAVARVHVGGRLVIRGDRGGVLVRLRFEGVEGPAPTSGTLVARRLIQAMRGHMTEDPPAVEIPVPPRSTKDGRE
jgi:signal transduction histidine kinase